MPQSIKSATITEMFPRVCIVGVGLLGGSFAAALRARGYRGHISGCGRRSMVDLVTKGLLDSEEESFANNQICNADLIYLAAPIGNIIEFLDSKSQLIKPGAIVTDAGSTKREIVAAAEKISNEATFVGGHPMAGSERTGAEYSDPQLFVGATYVLTYSKRANKDAISNLAQLVKFLDARPVLTDPETHDQMVALISQVPQLLATSLAAVAGSEPASESLFGLAGNGYRDMTRLAASKWSVWRDICRTNSDNMAVGLDKLIASLSDLRSALTNQDEKTISDSFDRANTAAEQLRQTKIKLFSPQDNFHHRVDTKSTENEN